MESIREERSSGRGLNEKLDKLLEMQEVTIAQKKREKEKKFKIPFGVGSKAKLKQNYALVWYIRSNGYVIPKFVPIRDGMIYVKEKQAYHAVESSDILRYKQYPFIIQPEWTLKPISTKDLSSSDQTTAEKVVINAVKLSQLKPQSAMSGKMILGIVVGLVIVIGILSQIMG
jgi:hypothetical protein